MEHPEETEDEDLPPMPDDVADAWAAVLIDVHEKVKQKWSAKESGADKDLS